ncbi:MAG: rRNA maturation RNase YbeY [Verrucomicrobia bacterium]|nr:MAG: rRNA maturation RNase YbeY [Verrucomicrobiota bacterium]
MRHSSVPRVEVTNRQRMIPISTDGLQRFAEVASALVCKHKQRRSHMKSLRVISVLVVSDRRMAQLHKQFCGISGPTDVLTFHHGEIVISVHTAARQARVFGNSLRGEIQLYLLHGLLHLAGYDDDDPGECMEMHQLQEKLLATLHHPSA